MTSTRLRRRRSFAAFLLAGMLALAAGCASPPDAGGHRISQDEAAPAAQCARLGDEIAQAEQARSVAAEESANAWKAVVPVVVLARKASGTAAVHEADSKLAALKEMQARRCVPS